MKTAFVFYITDNKHPHLGDYYGKKYFCKYYKLSCLVQAKTRQKKLYEGPNLSPTCYTIDSFFANTI